MNPQAGHKRSLGQRFSDSLIDPRLKDIDFDSDGRVTIHRQILREKKMIREVFQEIYRLCVDLDKRYFSGSGHRVELGAGASLFKELIHDLIVTDLKWARHLDLVVDGQQLPLRDDSVRAFYGLECFHHFARPESFFEELQRTLIPGGGCVLIEPYYGLVAQQLYKRLFKSEGFNPEQQDWSGAETTMGPMRGANQALSYIVFIRDRKIFEGRYPSLRLVAHQCLNNYLRYFFSGGLNFRPLLPNALSPLLGLAELALSPLKRILALHHVIVLRKIGKAPGD